MGTLFYTSSEGVKRNVALAEYELLHHSATAFALRGAAQGALGVEYVWTVIFQADSRSEAAQWMAACAGMQASGPQPSSRLAPSEGAANQVRAQLQARLPLLSVSLLPPATLDEPASPLSSTHQRATTGGGGHDGMPPLLVISLTELAASSTVRATDVAVSLHAPTCLVALRVANASTATRAAHRRFKLTRLTLRSFA